MAGQLGGQQGLVLTLPTANLTNIQGLVAAAAAGGIMTLPLQNLQGSLQTLEGCYEVSMQPSFLQAEQSQLSQPAFIREVLQSSYHPHGPPLDLLQQFRTILMLGPSELHAVFQVESHESRAGGESPPLTC
ncbi:hypothetical protein BTVI_156996 [Pitangus sulphuratus]|nr:hypothetical protein BTVI_156996 [Pitangus sulphuratus]